MGTELLQDDEVSALCDRCSGLAGIDLRHLLTSAGEDELRLTENAQPALCFMGVGLTVLLRRRGIEPAAAAGHSVGEYAALAATGSIDAAGVETIVFAMNTLSPCEASTRAVSSANSRLRKRAS